MAEPPSESETLVDAPFGVRLLRWLFYGIVVRALVLLALGVTVRHRQRLPDQGPAIIAANHNSHLDTMVLMSLFPLSMLPKLRPVAAADYFCKTPERAWFSQKILGIIPVARRREGGANPLAPCERALERGEILILFPEGSRGEPEALTGFKRGIGHLANAVPEAPVIPVFMHGLGKALPKGSAVLVPFNCTVSVGEPLYGQGSYAEFVDTLEAEMKSLAAAEKLPVWS
ncbi:2-acyl-glycerophospho-ethanolamine acyltransferase [Methyloligella halotolerans]|uniref:2-acyl-glycerophospho-ethanolamine acyltransferase n=1 Tax=Methyloligella halotolerans TaxID=1177755 RepID=A0A1E2RVE6_9HYPH|nr:lysophospholipid acyltransferase family protein [Methyloligella halotolerans]ODA66226.1 2-acyl-glycerophospho-ethanolamine acyltransferase [Methyloligella halotolerans]